ncbi:MAG: hypothetical protein VW405_01380 [Rhodospirillaceae bacterium]
MIRVNVDADRFLAGLTAAQRGTGFATTVAMTRTGKAVAAALGRETRTAFDRPTRTTINAFYSQPATKGLAAATVGVKDFLPKGTPASKYLQAQVFGGVRAQKRSERSLSRAGLMGNRGFWVPGPGVRLNAYGNVPGSVVTRILSGVKASSDATQNITASSRRTNLSARRAERFFVPRPGSGLAPGVWMERGVGRRLVPALLFVPSVSYSKRFDFFELGRRFTLAQFPLELSRAIGEGFNQPRQAG